MQTVQLPQLPTIQLPQLPTIQLPQLPTIQLPQLPTIPLPSFSWDDVPFTFCIRIPDPCYCSPHPVLYAPKAKADKEVTW